MFTIKQFIISEYDPVFTDKICELNHKDEQILNSTIIFDHKYFLTILIWVIKHCLNLVNEI